MKLSELQRECRRRSIWPGGELLQVKDRLLRFDCCPSRMEECELQTEEDAAALEHDIGTFPSVHSASLFLASHFRQSL